MIILCKLVLYFESYFFLIMITQLICKFDRFFHLNWWEFHSDQVNRDHLLDQFFSRLGCVLEMFLSHKSFDFKCVNQYIGWWRETLLHALHTQLFIGVNSSSFTHRAYLMVKACIDHRFSIEINLLSLSYTPYCCVGKASLSPISILQQYQNQESNEYSGCLLMYCLPCLGSKIVVWPQKWVLCICPNQH